MVHIRVFFIALCLCNVGIISARIYDCNRTANCGCSKNNVDVNKIVGGESAAISSWGWAVSLQRGLGNPFCGGVIVSPLHIITAAHCVTNATAILLSTKVVVGIDKLTDSKLSMAQVRSVTSVFSHPQYNAKSQANDIAVLRLNQSLTLSNERGTARICLPNVVPTNATDYYPASDLSLVAIGWGTLVYGAPSVPFDLQLQQVTLNTMLPRDPMCIPTIGDRRVQFCAAVRGGGKDTCQGDSGGPLMHFDSTARQWVLAGVTSYGTDCGNPAYAGVYTRVSVYRSWLKSIVNDGSVEISVTASATNWSGKIFSCHWLLMFGLYLLTFK